VSIPQMISSFDEFPPCLQRSRGQESELGKSILALAARLKRRANETECVHEALHIFQDLALVSFQSTQLASSGQGLGGTQIVRRAL
jgi:hypothetical protein